jgi:hypothetical protein
MTKERQGQRRASRSTTDLDAELEGIGAMTIDELRELWRQRRGRNPPVALSKELIARALAHWRQEELLGGPDRHVRKLLASLGRPARSRHAFEDRVGHRAGASGKAA